MRTITTNILSSTGRNSSRQVCSNFIYRVTRAGSPAESKWYTKKTNQKAHGKRGAAAISPMKWRVEHLVLIGGSQSSC